MDDQDKPMIITMRQTGSLPAPTWLGDTYTDQTCDECDAPVYVTSTSFDRMRDEGHFEYRIICDVCARPYIEQAIDNPDDELIAADPDLSEFMENNRSEFLAWLLGVTSNAEDE